MIGTQEITTLVDRDGFEKTLPLVRKQCVGPILIKPREFLPAQ